MEPSPPTVPVADPTLEPEGFIVVVESGDRSRFLAWVGADTPALPGVLASHGLSPTGWICAPIARRLAGAAGVRHVVTMDLRGHGLSDAPTDDGAYDLPVLGSDVVAVAEGSGLLAAP